MKKTVLSTITSSVIISAITLTTLTLTTACTQQNQSPKNNSAIQFLGGESQEIFSNRPQNKDQFIAVVKLKETPALQSLTLNSSQKRTIDPEVLKRINAEQELTIKALKELSSDIKILFRYKLTLNAISILAPSSLEDKIKELASVAYVESAGQFTRPIVQSTPNDPSATKSKLGDRNSVKFIGAKNVHRTTTKDKNGNDVPVDGRGMKVGIIDTGIDYTHAMLGGDGSPETYKSIDPAKQDNHFPNRKVIGGIDFVGTVYNAASQNFNLHIPQPDENPIDEQGHGSHVAGTVAGIGDDTNTYSGVAPGADLYALKVFGADGSTSDPVVIAALEYAADPNKDGNLDDQLDVVNMSLGSSYGSPHMMYAECIKNLSEGGTVVVASAGNSGAQDYIVGAPSVSEDAISVAASVDDSAHNYQFKAVKFTTATQGEKLAEAIEAISSKPIAEAGSVVGKLVFIGFADKDLSPEMKEKLKGNVALIDRGFVAFTDKLKRAADGGAIGVVVANNQPGSAFVMGGNGKFDFPAIMITQALGDLLKKDLDAGVTIQFNTPEKIERPELIDTLADFSSKGPRSLDALLKPEISAPGKDVISAAFGKGMEGIKFSGTSMAGPHIAGAMALLKQAHSELNSIELKSMLMGHAKSLTNSKGETYPLSMQGAGRVQIDSSHSALVTADQVAMSLGEVNLISRKTIRQTINLKNLTNENLILLVRLSGDKELSLKPISVTLSAKETKPVTLSVQLSAQDMKESLKELNAIIEFVHGTVVHKLPVLAIARKISALQAKNLFVFSSSEEDAAGAAAEVKITNSSPHDGEVLAFNLLGTDSRKPNKTDDASMSRACDLQTVGYRIIERTIDNTKVKVLQVAGKLFEPMTTWHSCELSVLIDTNDDQLPEQELALINTNNISGLGGPADKFLSILLDAPKARKIRADFEEAVSSPNGDKAEEDYAGALLRVLPAQLYNNSTIIMAETLVSDLARRESGELAIKVASIHNDSGATEMDDFLPASDWLKVSLNEKSHPFHGMQEQITIKGLSSMTLNFVKGEGLGDLLLLFPQNRTVFSDLITDKQSEILKPVFNPQSIRSEISGSHQ